MSRSYAEKVDKHVRADLDPGESVRVAAKVQMAGTDAARAAGSVSWDRAIASDDTRKTRDQAATLDLDGLSHNLALVLTDRRVLLYERGKLFGGIKAMVAAWPHEDVEDLRAPKTRAGSKVALSLSDGRRLELEFPLNQTDPELARAWSELRD